jgi:hypothetical protein
MSTEREREAVQSCISDVKICGKEREKKLTIAKGYEILIFICGITQSYSTKDLSNIHYNLAAGSNKCFISEFGYSTFWDESGRCRSHAHFSVNSGANSPSIICVIYLPRTGKNLYPWNEPQVAIYNPLDAE